MVVTKYYDVRKVFKVGDVVYACAFEYSHEKESKALHQKPVRGMLAVCKTEEKNRIALEKGDTSIGYFIPFKKNSNELAWSKAVQMSSRKYASTYEECVGLYNQLIRGAIFWHQQEIANLTNELIQLR